VHQPSPAGLEGILTMTRRSILLAVSLLWAALAAANPSPQATGLGTMGGQVLGLDRKPVAGARVTLQTADGTRPHSTETNAQGHFWFPMISSGLYHVRAYSKGLLSEWRQNVWVPVGRQTNVTLAKP